MSRALVCVLLALPLLAGCASNAARSVIVDMRGVDPRAYEDDLAECERYAEQVRTGETVAANAAMGAVVGAGVGVLSDRDDSVRRGAAGGAVVGSAVGAGKSYSEQERVIRNCLRNRGYSILN